MSAGGEHAGLLPVYAGGELIGTAASWREAEDLLVERGLNAGEAANAIRTRGIRTDKAFHIIAAGPVEQMLRDLRAIRSRSA